MNIISKLRELLSNDKKKDVNSQSSLILNSLSKGEKLTSLDILKKFGCFRASARIYDLRARQYPIETKMIVLPNGKRVAQYSMKIN